MIKFRLSLRSCVGELTAEFIGVLVSLEGGDILLCPQFVQKSPAFFFPQKQVQRLLSDFGYVNVQFKCNTMKNS